MVRPTVRPTNTRTDTARYLKLRCEGFLAGDSSLTQIFLPLFLTPPRPAPHMELSAKMT